jgi:hypothetical protein
MALPSSSPWVSLKVAVGEVEAIDFWRVTDGTSTHQLQTICASVYVWHPSTEYSPSWSEWNRPI